MRKAVSAAKKRARVSVSERDVQNRLIYLVLSAPFTRGCDLAGGLEVYAL